MYYVQLVLKNIWDVYLSLAPYLFIGLTFAGILHVFVGTDLITRYLGKKGFWSSFKAAILGVPLPLCSCGVIPTAFQLRKSGASKGATIAFLISTPQTGVDSIVATYGMMGPFFGIFRPIYALISGIIGGTVADLVHIKDDDSHIVVEGKQKIKSKDKGNIFIRFIKYAYGEFLDDLTKNLIIGIILAGLISLIPDSFFLYFSENYVLSYIIVAMIGIPLYVCSTGSIPIALALMAKGMSPGAILLFLIVGPATNVATITLITKALGKKMITIYLTVIALAGILGGIMLDLMDKKFSIHISDQAMSPDHMAHSPFLMICTILFSIMFAISIFKYLRNLIKGKKHCHGGSCSCSHSHEEEHNHNHEGQTNVMSEYLVPSMRCHHCEANIKNALLRKVPEDEFEIDLALKTVKVKSNHNREEISAIIEGAGYSVES